MVCARCQQAVNAELDKRHAAAVAAARAAGVPPPEDSRANAAAKEDPMASLLALTAKNKSKKRGDGSDNDAGQWLRTGKHGKDASAGTTAKGDTAPSLPDRVPRGKPQQLPVAGKRPQENRDAAEWHAARARELAEALARANAMVVAYRCVTCDLNVVCRTCGYSCHRDHHLQVLCSLRRGSSFAMHEGSSDGCVYVGAVAGGDVRGTAAGAEHGAAVQVCAVCDLPPTSVHLGRVW